MNRHEWAIARSLFGRQHRDCINRGHPVYHVGPYLICRSLRCDVLVVRP